MLIAIDYDGTYTKDPDFWLQFINNAIDSGHTVICATMRHEYEIESMCEKLRKAVSVVNTNRKAKFYFLQDMGINPDIWIDDKPGWLFTDAG